MRNRSGNGKGGERGKWRNKYGQREKGKGKEKREKEKKEKVKNGK